MTAIADYFRDIRDRDVMLLLLGFFAGAVTVSLVSHFLGQAVNLWAWLDSFSQNFGTEMFGAFLTFLLIEVLVSSRKEKERLIREMGSRVNEDAVRAAEELRDRDRGWLQDGSLQKADLHSANLAGADLRRANLAKANLRWANLQGTRLWKANLQGTTLVKANLKGANLGGADLQGADLLNAEYDESTILPDGTKWTPDTDMARFTHPEHPEFWRSDDPKSPAYRGRGGDDDEEDNNNDDDD